MSIPGTFLTEDDDIVSLLSDNDETCRGGWVNVGTFALKIELNDSGNLLVVAYARGNEDKDLAEFRVEKAAAVAQGGVDYD